MSTLTPFGFSSTALDVVQGIDATGRHVVITGAASGIGAETARAIAHTGASLTLAVRSVDAGHRVAAELTEATGNQRIDVRRLDLGDLTSIADFVDGWSGPLHVLINNAGIMATPETRSGQGWESQFATNHLGHFALTSGLRAALANANGSRVVNVSSIGHRRSPVVFDDIHFANRPYDKWSAYGQSKTANVLHAVALSQRWADDGIAANALHPGGIMTNLQRHMEPAEFEAMGWVDADGNLQKGFKTAQQGAATSAMLAMSPIVDGVSGQYFEDCNPAVPATPDDRSRGVQQYALDPEQAQRLWDYSIMALANA